MTSHIYWPTRLARDSVELFVMSGKHMDIPGGTPDEFDRPAGVFVCLKNEGGLRGCVGTIEPVFSGIDAEIIANAAAAASRDPRFRPVGREELAGLSYTVDILHQPELIESMESLDPARYGVIVTSGERRGLLLPRLEGIDDPETQTMIARRKAGIGPSDQVNLRRFAVDRYGE